MIQFSVRHLAGTREAIIYRDCPGCGDRFEKRVDGRTLTLLEDHSVSVQSALPQWTPEERERIMTGFCPKCWNKVFK